MSPGKLLTTPLKRVDLETLLHLRDLLHAEILRKLRAETGSKHFNDCKACGSKGYVVAAFAPSQRQPYGYRGDASSDSASLRDRN